MIRTALIAVAVAWSGSAVAQENAHAGHAGHGSTQSAAPLAVTTTPADGAMTHGSPARFEVTFPHPLILRAVTLTAEGVEPVSIVAPEAPAAATVGVDLPRLAPGNWTAEWSAAGKDGDEISGTVRFMVH